MDYTVADTIYAMFTTRAFATGIPTVLAGTPAVSAYENDSATQITAGITLGVSHDSVVGMNLLTIVASGANGYEAGKDYNLIITTGTVGGVSVVGEVVGTFSLSRSAAAVDLANVTDGLGAIKGDTAAVKVTTDKFAFTVANQVDANAIAISGDTTAADNLELQYDTTGLAGDTFPASQSQVASIGTISGGGQPFEITADNTGGAIKGVTFVGSQTGTFANTEAEDGSYHVIDDTGNAIDIVYQTNVGGSRVGSRVNFEGFLNSNNDALNIQAYDFIGADWETVLVLSGQNGATNIPLAIPILLKHTGTGADLGDVLIRFVGSAQSNPQLNVDLLHIEAVGATSAIGFEGGAVWMNTVSGTSGTAEGVGFYNRPSDNITDALAIMVANNFKTIQSLPGSSFTLPSSVAGLEFRGFSYTVALNGQAASGAKFKSAIITGNDSGTNAIPTVYDGCRMGSNTLGLHNLHNRCELGGDIILAEAGTYTWVDPVSHVAGSGAPSVDFEAAAETKALNVRGIFGGLEIRNYNAGGGAHTMTLGGTGQRIFNASCAGGSLEQRGQFKETDNAGGAVTVVRDEVSQGVIDIEVDTSEIGTAGAGLTAVSLASTGLDAIVSTATGMVEIAKAVWDRIISKANHDIGQSAGKILRQAGDLIQIDGAVSDASPTVGGFDTTLTQVDGYFNDGTLAFSNGSANAGIGFPVSLYVNANGRVTFESPDQWPVTPVNGDDFVIVAIHTHPVAQVADAVLDEALSGHTVAGSLGKAISDTESDVTAIKVKTDDLTYTKANELDANIQSVNDVTVNGTGASGDEWGP